ncbi:hypothetical protein ACFUIZ_18130 [Streptomyces cinereoruber]|uniref:hypothetical protein n=1 Tax=Streptomyces cinereoruber TaxID=67260 RepID=UPI00363B2C29
MVNRSQAPADPAHGSPAAPRMHGGWLARGTEGRFSVYVPRDGEVVRWTEGPGHRYSGPVDLGGDGLWPYLGVAQGPDRYAHMVGIRSTGTGEGYMELVHSVQFQTGRPNAAWKSLGHSNAQALWYGNPAVTVDPQGRLYVFTRNGGGGVSCRAQKDNGAWHPWWDLQGNDTDQNPVAAVTGAGLVELYTSTHQGLRRYVQSESGGKPVGEALVPTPMVQGTLAAVTGPSGHVTAFYTDGQGRICAWSPGRGLAPTPFAAAVGNGPLTATACLIDGYECTVLAQCDGEGRPAFAAYVMEREETGLYWTASGPAVLGPPALATDAGGALTAAALTADGGVAVTRQKAEPGLSLEPWVRI